MGSGFDESMVVAGNVDVSGCVLVVAVGSVEVVGAVAVAGVLATGLEVVEELMPPVVEDMEVSLMSDISNYTVVKRGLDYSKRSNTSWHVKKGEVGVSQAAAVVVGVKSGSQNVTPGIFAADNKWGISGNASTLEEAGRCDGVVCRRERGREEGGVCFNFLGPVFCCCSDHWPKLLLQCWERD